MSKEFELARLIMLRAAKSGEIEPVRGYAWSRRIFPLQPYPLEEAFESDFHVTRETVGQILKAIDEKQRKGLKVNYYTDIEGSFGKNIDRMMLISVCRLAFLDNRFDDGVWRALIEPGSGPIESQGMTSAFDPTYDLEI